MFLSISSCANSWMNTTHACLQTFLAYKFIASTISINNNHGIKYKSWFSHFKYKSYFHQPTFDWSTKGFIFTIKLFYSQCCGRKWCLVLPIKLNIIMVSLIMLYLSWDQTKQTHLWVSLVHIHNHFITKKKRSECLNYFNSSK